MYIRTMIALSIVSGLVWGQSPDLAFKADKADEFTFNTGPLSGKAKVDPQRQGIISLIDGATGTELTKGGTDFGLFSHYRMLGPNSRWGAIIWQWPKSAKVLADGGLQIDWSAADDHPAELAAIFRWAAPDTLDVETIIKPQKDMPKLEIFVGSYFKPDAKGYVYLSPARYGPAGPGELVACDINALMVGTYLSFPRDLAAAQLVYDGRWDQGLHPVQWSITRYLAGPLSVRQDAKSGVSILLMSRPQDCFAINCSYNPPPADGVANHFSTYLSLFGRDVKAGETAKACSRLGVRKNLAPADAIKVYEDFVKGKK